MKSALVIRHLAFEDLGAFAVPLRDAGYAAQYLEAGVDDFRAREPEDPDLVIVLGGPIGACDDRHYPWLNEEAEWLGRRLQSQRPTMGICLGAQMIARALGAAVYPNAVKEIGLGGITLTEAGRESCLAPFATAPTTLHWHGDTFDLPEGTTLLASSNLCRNQAFAKGPNIIGFQFHPEAEGAGFERWLIGHACELAGAGILPGELRGRMAEVAAELEDKARRTLTLWLGGLEPH